MSILQPPFIWITFTDYRTSMALRELTLLSFFLVASSLFAETAADYVNRGAQKYIFGEDQAAASEVATGLRKFPNDPELQGIAGLLRKKKPPPQNQQEQNQQKQQQQQQGQGQQQQQQQKDQQSQGKTENQKDKQQEEKDQTQAKNEPQKQQPG